MKPYSGAFYAGHLQGSIESARRIVPRLVEIFRPGSMLDVGCGSGAFLAEAMRLGVTDCMGVDGSPVAAESLQIPERNFLVRDLSEPLALGRRFDLVLSTEVAEHLPPERARQFVENLTRHGANIAFSAAVPGQFGRCHLNEQWPSYWVKLFEAEGFQVWDGLRQSLWQDTAICWWYRQNLLLFTRRDAGEVPSSLVELSSRVRGCPLDIAHPEFVEIFRDTLKTYNSPYLLARRLARALIQRVKGWRGEP